MFAAYLKEGLDAVEILRRSVEVTKEFEYDATLPNVRDRIKPRFVSTKLVPVKNRILSEVLNPQPRCSELSGPPIESNNLGPTVIVTTLVDSKNPDHRTPSERHARSLLQSLH